MPVTRQINFEADYDRIDVEDWEAAFDLHGAPWHHPGQIIFLTAIIYTGALHWVARYASDQ